MIRFEEMDAKERLKEYIEKDEIYEDYKKDNLMNASDFEKFCIQHCKDIEEILEEIRQLKKQLDEINNFIKKSGFVNIEQVMLNYCGLLGQQKELIKYLEDEIYSIQPKGTGINYNCEYDSEEDYVMAMQEQSRLNTLKEILQKYKSIIGDINEKK